MKSLLLAMSLAAALATSGCYIHTVHDLKPTHNSRDDEQAARAPPAATLEATGR